MALIVQKFGGTSVGSIEKIQQVAAKVIQTRAQGHEVVVVVSAMAGETDRLINLAKMIQSEPDPREYAVLATTGEQVSIALLTMALLAQGHKARSFTGAQAQILTDEHYRKARILGIDGESLREALAAGCIPVVAGFQGISETGEVTTLGRGGSDTTAMALAAALQADECQIYTDVDGVYTADPKIVPKAHCLEHITCAEMLELASLGVKVLQPRSVEFARRYHVPLRVLSTFNDNVGTLVGLASGGMEQPAITGIAISHREAMLTLYGLAAYSEIVTEALLALGAAHIDIDMLVQGSIVSGNADFSFTLARDDYPRARDVLRGRVDAQKLSSDLEVAKLSLVGVGLRSHPAIISKVFKTLGEEGIPVQLATAGEIKASVVISEKHVERGARALHTAFGLDLT